MRTAFSVLLGGALLVLAGTAQAQQPQPQPPADTSYVEHKSSDGQDIRFRDDPMTALAGNPVGAQLTGFHPPRRFDLMHPRNTFVPELLKSVEHM
ncbi:MAG TPA: hypothetical protein VF765_11815 [Polyangiaceae bacterium]